MITIQLCLLLWGNPATDQAAYFAHILREFDTGQTLKQSLAQRMLALAIDFEGKPYIANSLETPGREQLVVRLDGFDCFTLVESVFALGLTMGDKDPNWETFTEQLKRIRYRQGQLIDYASRLHYTSDWAFDNDEKDLVKDISKSLGGVAYLKIIDFMTQHRKAYRQLADHVLFAKMARIETAINQRAYHYINEERLAEVEHLLQPGDIIAITTSIKGLDIAHVGLARFVAGRLHMLHASTSHKQVETTAMPLVDYLKANSRQTGIMVFRPLTPIASQADL